MSHWGHLKDWNLKSKFYSTRTYIKSYLQNIWLFTMWAMGGSGNCVKLAVGQIFFRSRICPCWLFTLQVSIPFNHLNAVVHYSMTQASHAIVIRFESYPSWKFNILILILPNFYQFISMKFGIWESICLVFSWNWKTKHNFSML